MRVLVTGGAGFIGSHVVQQSLAAGLEVAVLDDFSTGKRDNVPAGVRVFEVDVRDRGATERALADFAPAVVSHHAAQSSVPASLKDPQKDAEINVAGGLNVLDACVKSQVRHVVFASTGGAIYGEVPDGQSAAEQFPAEPKSPYGLHKLTFERFLAVYREQHRLESSVLRYANVYGPRQAAHGEAGVVAIFLERALTGRSLPVFGRRLRGDEGCVRDYAYVGDVARANVAALTGKLTTPLLNVGSGRATTTRELAEHVRDLCGTAIGITHAEPRVGDVERSLLDATLFERLLGPTAPLASGLRQTADWYRAS